jgi:hypothetical protein
MNIHSQAWIHWIILLTLLIHIITIGTSLVQIVTNVWRRLATIRFVSTFKSSSPRDPLLTSGKQWGFSYEWVIIAIAINGAWLLGLWIVWIDADTNSQLCKKGRRMGLWRVVANLLEAMREDLGPNVCACSNKELLNELRKRDRVKYYIGKRVDRPKHIGLSSQTRGLLDWTGIRCMGRSYEIRKCGRRSMIPRILSKYDSSVPGTWDSL